MLGSRPTSKGVELTLCAGTSGILQRESGSNRGTLARFPNMPQTGSQRTRHSRSHRFLPQGVYEDNIDWPFPTISDRKTIFDKFCGLPLTYRTNGFITMLTPIRDYLDPPNPILSPFLCATRVNYFSRLFVNVDPRKSGFKGGQWVVLEDVNVEHLLDTSTSIDTKSEVGLAACTNFLTHLYWYGGRRCIGVGSRLLLTRTLMLRRG